MKLHYYPETDSFYIELKPDPSVDSREVADGIIFDIDADGNPVDIDIDGASQRLDLTSLEATSLPLATTAA